MNHDDREGEDIVIEIDVTRKSGAAAKKNRFFPAWLRQKPPIRGQKQNIWQICEETAFELHEREMIARKQSPRDGLIQ